MIRLADTGADVTAKILQVLAEAATPLPTREIEEAAGYGVRYGQLCYRMLCRLARLGALVKITLPDVRSRYCRSAAAKPHAYRESPPWRTVRHLTS
jgi:hypothetical protein